MMTLKRKFEHSSASPLPTVTNFKTKLPPELWKHIFNYLSNRREHIAACRRVCKDFKSWSSEFLILRVIFAKRLDTIQRLWEVLEHPYFRECVTELVYDASAYEESLATDLENYEEACDGHSARTFFDHEAMMERQRYAQFYRRVCPNRPPSPHIIESENLHEKGIHHGFQDYFRRWWAQNRMIEDGLDSDVVKEALLRLRNLRRIIFTDFRELARKGEGYGSLCRRTFGNTLEPLNLNFSSEVCQEFLLLMNMIAKIPTTKIQSLSIGGHPYESSGDFCKIIQRNVRRTCPSAYPPSIPYELDDHLGSDSESTRQVCQKLRHLRLPICFSNDRLHWVDADVDFGMDDTLVGHFLHSSAPGLVRLSLCASNLLQFSHDRGLRIRAGRRCLVSLLFPVTFTSLQHLELCGWPLPRGSFQEFLSKHSSTLKQICLAECVVLDDPTKLGQWVGDNMCLDGVQINTRAERSDEGEVGDRCRLETVDLEMLWLNGRPNSLRQHNQSRTLQRADDPQRSEQYQETA